MFKLSSPHLYSMKAGLMGFDKLQQMDLKFLIGRILKNMFLVSLSEP